MWDPALLTEQELLVKHMVNESYTNARLDKRKNLRYDDLSTWWTPLVCADVLSEGGAPERAPRLPA